MKKIYVNLLSVAVFCTVGLAMSSYAYAGLDLGKLGGQASASGAVQLRAGSESEHAGTSGTNNASLRSRTETDGHVSALGNGVTASAALMADAHVPTGKSGDASLPPGIERAPGIEGRIENGKGLPQGILMRLFGKAEGKATLQEKHEGDNDDRDEDKKPATTTADVRAPLILGVTAKTGTSSASVRFFTNEKTEAKVFYAAGASVSASSTVRADAGFSRKHQIELLNLLPDTLYSYMVVAMDASGNIKESAVSTLTTEAAGAIAADTAPPRILLHFTVGVDENSAKILFVTNEPADAKVFLGTTEPAVATGTPTAAKVELSYFHEIEVAGLASSTTYFYTIVSADASGNASVRSNGSFKTDTL